jgi:hypothetical protein
VGEVPDVVVWLPPTRFQRTVSPTLMVTVEGENAKSSTNTSTVEAPVPVSAVVVVAPVVVVPAVVVVGAAVVVVVGAVVVVGSEVTPPQAVAATAAAKRSAVLFIRHSTHLPDFRVRHLISFREWISWTWPWKKPAAVWRKVASLLDRSSP